MDESAVRQLRKFVGADADAAMIGVFVIMVFVALHFAGYFFAPLLSAIVLGLLVSPVAERLERAGLPSNAAAGLILVATLAALTGVMYGLVMPLSEWADRAPQLWYRTRLLVDSLEEPLRNIDELRKGVRSVLGPQETKVIVESGEGNDVQEVVSAVPAIFGQIMIFVGAYFFFLAGRKDLKRSIAGLFVRASARRRAFRLMRRIELSVSRYLATITLVNIGFGVSVTLMLWAMGMPQPWIWGAMAFALNFIPYLGPALMAITLFAVGLIAFSTPGWAFLCALFFIGLNVIEGQFVTPSAIGRSSTINPFLIFCAIAFGLWFWGAIGAFLAAPIALVLRDVAAETSAARVQAAGIRAA